MTAALENTSVLIVLFSATNFFDQACLSLDAPQRPGNEKGRRKRGALGGRSGCGAWIRTKDLRVMSPTSCRCSTPRVRLYPRLFWSPETSVRPGHGLGVALGDGGAGVGVPVTR